ncbi:putative autophagy-related protein 11 [Dysidea avara]|uniref:putative autophagy-related protein 11 n=1 Tax=Dysidea avara TaxID=196820 RepID=UPI0033237AC0
MALDYANIQEWTVDETKQWAELHFGEDTALQFEANRVDGETLKMLGEEGSMEQFKACGLSTVMEQLKVKRLLKPAAAADANVPVAQYSPMARTGYKLTKRELNDIPAKHKMVYLMMRNKVAKEARRVWPGNDIPLFRGNKENQAKLNALVEELEECCTTEFFTKDCIKQHIICTLSERRRHIKLGYDYVKSPKTEVAVKPKGVANDQQCEKAKKQGEKAKKEGEKAKKEGEKAKKEGEKAKKEGEKAKKEGEKAKKEGEKAKKEGEKAKKEGEKAKKEGEKAKKEGEKAKLEGEKPKKGEEKANKEEEKAKNKEESNEDSELLQDKGKGDVQNERDEDTEFDDGMQLSV